MDSTPATTIVQLASRLLWQCLKTCDKSMKHPCYATVLPDLLAVEGHLSAVSFAPGLLDILQATTPPASMYFKSLPAGTSTQWGVYLVLMEKAGHSSRLYCGSGTSYDKGVKDRLRHYDTQDPNIGIYVAKSFQEGFVVAHKGLLCWAPTPSAASCQTIRVVFHALEALFTFSFWALKAKTEFGYGMTTVCLWDRSSLGYEGLCSHNPLKECPSPNLHLTGVELEEIARWRKENKTAWVKKYLAQKRKEDPESIRAIHVRQHAKEDKDEVRVKQQARNALAIAEKKHHCEVCGFRFVRAAHLKDHFATPSHLEAVAKAKARYDCDICEFKVTKFWSLEQHCAGLYHNLRAERYCFLCKKLLDKKIHYRRHLGTLKHKAAAAAQEKN